MANKIYSVMKGGEVLKELKTLAAAKKLADEETAVVFCDGTIVYSPVANEEYADVAYKYADTAKNTEVDTTTEVETYRLKHRMNVRKAPSLDAEKVGTKPVGTVVEATLEDDWLHLTDGTFILYDGGKFAVKI